MKTLEDIVPKVTDKTRAGLLRWQTTNTASKYDAALGNYIVSVWEWVDQDDGSEGVSFAVSKKGEPHLLDTVYFDKYSSRYDKLYDLFSMARRSALKLDQIVDDIDSQLDGLG